MDPDSIKNAARLAFDREVGKRNLRAKMSARLSVEHRGGLFRVTPELFVLLGLGDAEMVLLDAYDTPILVDVAELRALATSRYHEVMNEWRAQWERAATVRRAADA
jgi:hypothetical protein